MSAQKQHPFSIIETEEPLFFNWPILSQLTNPSTQRSDQGSDISIWEDDNHVVVECTLPGIKKEEAEITFEKGVITIQASPQEKEEDLKRKYFHKRTDSFLYRLSVPGKIDTTQEPKASLTNGVMSVVFTKQKLDQPKKIRIE